MTNAPGRRRPSSAAGPLGGGPAGRRRLAGLAAGCCLTVLAAGCGAGQLAGTASQQPRARHSSHAVTAEVSRADLRIMAATYLAIARPANHRLDVEVDGYGDRERDDLAAARADLRGEATTERLFDGELLQIRFPSWIGMTARALVSANQRRIRLTERQARSASLARLRAFDRRHSAANAAVETQARLIRQFLGLPPPETS